MIITKPFLIPMLLHIEECKVDSLYNAPSKTPISNNSGIKKSLVPGKLLISYTALKCKSLPPWQNDIWPIIKMLGIKKLILKHSLHQKLWACAFPMRGISTICTSAIVDSSMRWQS